MGKNTRKNRNKSTKTIKKCPCKEEVKVGFKSIEDEYESSKYYTPDKASLNSQNKLVKLLNTPFSPSKLTARSDYYNYINYQWLKEQDKDVKKKFFVQVDNFRIVQEKVYYEVIDMVKEYIKQNKHTKKGEAVNNVYQSCLRLDRSTAVYHVKKTITDIDDLIAQNNLWVFLAEVNKNEIVSWSSPIFWNVTSDLKDSSTFRNTISPGQVSLYDYSLYYTYPEDDVATTKYKRRIMSRFLDFIDKVFTSCLGANHGLEPLDVVEVEKEILGFYTYKQIKYDSTEFYNVVKGKEALSKYGFDWEAFCKQLGFKKTPEWFVSTGLNYLTIASATLSANWKTPKWRTYWIYIHLKQLIRFDKEWRKIYYEFFENFVGGQDSIFPSEIYPIFGLSATFNTLLTDMYMEKNRNQTIIDYVQNLGDDLKRVFIRIIKRNKWLSPSTKATALKKFDYMKLIIGSPSGLREDPLLDYKEDDAWGNMIKIANWRVEKAVTYDGKPVIDIPTFNWQTFKMSGKQAYIVNCFYFAPQNSIFIPLAYLQKPFIDLEERGIEYNLAHIGYALGHELSHSLDTTGSNYDYLGNKKSWWTPHDRKIFNKKVEDVIKQYETFAAYDGVKFDAAIGSGEDLADISGLAICTEYLRDFQDRNDDPVPIRALSFHAFYVYIALQGRQKVKRRAFAIQLKTNPHPMEQFRVNCSLSRLELFCSLYNIKKGDKMYWPNKDTIW
jgi:predicted metalloendopeptidase